MKKRSSGPPLGGKTIGLLIGLPLATACIVATSMIAMNLSNNLAPQAKMQEPVYDTPAYAANLTAPEDIDFNRDDIDFAGADKTKVVSAQTENGGSSGGRSGPSYNASDYAGVYAGNQNVTESEDITEVLSDEVGTITGIAQRTGNDISDQIWKDDAVTTYNSFTTTEAVADASGKLGTLNIPDINLSVSIYETVTDEMEAMSRGLAHFNSTSSWDGNVGLCGHNWTESGNGAYFKDLHKVSKGDTVNYTTELGTRTYKVINIVTVDENDWSYLNRTDDNRITLVTCTFNDASKRLVVQGVAQ